jgi:hypothetical protein
MNQHCERCGYIPSYKHCLKSHLKKVHKCPPLLCDIDVTTLYNKYFPVKTPTRYKCTHCDKSFSSRQNKSRHIIIAHKQYQYDNENAPLESQLEESNTSSNDNYVGYVYLLHPIEYINTNQHIYKIGHSKSNTANRILNGYKKGTCIILVIETQTPFEHEAIIKSTLNNTPGIKLASGSEYFEGDKNIIKHAILNIVFKTTVLINKP